MQATTSQPYLEFRLSTPITLVLSVDDDFSWPTIAERRWLMAAPPPLTAERPVALDIVLDLVIPRA